MPPSSVTVLMTWKAVLPVTADKWISGTSSYHNICVLPNGTFLAFLNGRGEYVNGKGWQYAGLGFATSQDGINWDYFPDNPIIEGELRGLANGLIGYLGDGEYLVLWSEKWDLIYGTTRDFKKITRDPRGPANWKGALICPWREGNKLYLFTQRSIHIMELPVEGH